MRCLIRNKQSVTYELYSGKTMDTDSAGNYTGDYTETYEPAVTVRMNVSPAKGTASEKMFGIDTEYSKTMVTDDMSCPISETTVVTIGGQKYRVVRVAKSLTSIAYAIKEIE